MPELVTEVVRHTGATQFWLGWLLALGVAAVSLRRGLRAFWQLRLIQDTPTAKVRSAPQGYVELIGQARPWPELAPAELTGIPCCWYRWRIEKYNRSSRSKQWRTIDHGQFEHPFLLDDGTGECLIDPEGAHLRCRITERWFSPYPRGGRSMHPSFGELFGNGNRYRMTEERIAEGEPLFVLGHHETPRRGVQERDELMRQLLRQWKQNPQRMRRFDLDGDGELNAEEWERVRALAAKLAARAERRVSAQPVRARIGASTDPRRPYLISTAGEAALVGQSRWQALGGTLFGAGLSVALLATLVARLD